MTHKAVGETGITPAVAAISNAVLDTIGVPITTLPNTPRMVVRGDPEPERLARAGPRSVNSQEVLRAWRERADRGGYLGTRGEVRRYPRGVPSFRISNAKRASGS